MKKFSSNSKFGTEFIMGWSQCTLTYYCPEDGCVFSQKWFIRGPKHFLNFISSPAADILSSFHQQIIHGGLTSCPALFKICLRHTLEIPFFELWWIRHVRKNLKGSYLTVRVMTWLPQIRGSIYIKKDKVSEEPLNWDNSSLLQISLS